MTQQRRRGFLASQDGSRHLDNKMREMSYTQERLATEAEVGEQQVKNLLHPHWGRKTQKDAIQKIAKVLQLEPTDIVDPNHWYPPVQTRESTDSLVVKPSRERLSTLPNQNLPPQDNKFIGREKELCDLMRYLSEDHAAPIITVDGIGGVGKTALVVEAAYRCLEYREYGNARSDSSTLSKITCEIPLFDAIIFTSAKENQLLPDRILDKLTSQRTLQEIMRKISITLDEPSIMHENEIERIRKRLRQQKVLLIIDNLETIENKNRVLSFLYELPKTVKSVITTREQIGVCFVPIHLESLSKRESKQLIQQQADDKGISLTNEDKNNLIKASGGIPIVIIYTMGRLAMSNSLTTVLADLKSNHNDVAHFCFKQSVDDLKRQHEHAYRLLMSIAIFHKSPDRDAVVEVAGLSTEPMISINKGLEKLQQISLIRLYKGRYIMLPLTREYALAELRKNQEFKKEALNRWLEWYKKFAKKHHEPEKKPERFFAGYNRLHEEWENLLAVLRWCKDEERYEDVKELWSYLNNYANLRGHWQDRRFWLGWIIKASTLRGEHKTTLGAKSRKGRTLLLMGKPDDLENAEKLLLEAWELRQYGDFDDLDYLTNHLAGLYLRLEKPEEAHKWLNREQEILNDKNLTNEKRIAHQIYIDRERSEVLFEQGRYSQAQALCNQVIQESDKIKNQRQKNYSQKILADIAIAEGEFDKAENLLFIGFDEVKAAKDKRRTAYYLASFAKLEKARSNFNKAREYANKAHNYFIELGMIRDAKKVKFLLNSIICK
ncbi:NB-ARC domain-containing protein [Coleofasciculus chthonoplastes]|jgi:hypothetical protein|uniref:NB-ARC domain-containing protein n=1 Tax=Coleofasciculus chthonoplastes TaxID=64178 RepID=UPI0032FD7F84